MIVTGEVDGYRALPPFLVAITCRANSARMLRFRTPEKLYSCETILKRRSTGEITSLCRLPGLGAIHKKPEPLQKKGKDLLPSVTFTHDPLNHDR
jgi:hypothetical protein